MTMEDRVAVLERDVGAIKSELAVMKHDLANAVELNPRVSHIELELVAIRRDITQLQKDVSLLQTDVAQLQRDVSQLQKDVAQLQRDVSQLQKDVSQLQRDFTEMKGEMVSIRMVLTTLNTEQSHYATKADLSALEARMQSALAQTRSWMVVIAISIVAANFGMIYPLYSAMKPTPVVTPAPAQQTMPLTRLVLHPG